MNNILKWLEEWYASQCDGEWEHENGLKISTVDNPGWFIEIDLTLTEIESLEILNDTIENGENDWYFYNVKDKKFMAGGDPSKLSFLLEKFKEIAVSK